MEKDRFRGPLFIIGIGRSGTKLVRHLLNGNQDIGIPAAESSFIPRMIKQFGNPPAFPEKKEFESFYEAYTKTSFYWHMKRVGRTLSRDKLEREADKTSWRSIFEVILRHHVQPGKNRGFIWGDKTPSYVYHVTLLKELYPECKFLHVIRDPRDICLSTKKIWGTHIYTCAEKWRRGVEAARANGRKLGDDYMEVHYEALLEDPEKILRGICGFLQCEFSPEMIHVRRTIEHDGDAQGEKEIITQNSNKYLNQLSQTQIRRIEEIAYPVMKDTPYEIRYADHHMPLGSYTCRVYTIFSKWNRLKYDIRSKGLPDGMKYYFGVLRKP